MNKLKELRNKVKKNNKGFSLVELIVVIVILAILIGVTIGGIYQYVNKSRINTDINNAASIQSVIATIATDENVNKAFSEVTTGTASISLKWSDVKKGETEISGIITSTGITDADNAVKNAIAKKLNALLTDGLPASKSNGSFKIVIEKADDGSVKATCKAYSDKDATTELQAQS